MMEVLRGAGAHIGVVFHDAQPYSGTRMVDVLRRFVQRRTMRRILRSSDQGILTVPAAKLCWISSEMKNVVFIPVGANFSSVSPSASESTLRQDETPTVAVYGVTGGVAGRQEISQITTAVRFASERLGRLRLMIFGRNADSAEASLRNGLRDLPVVLAVSGVLPEIEVQRALHASDVLLFVRGPISSRRGSAIAGISCGLPIIAFSGSETAAPITDAGVVLVPGDNKIALGEALVRVLRDREYHARLAERSRTAYNYHFSWAAIAARYAEVLNAPPDAYKP
jgi:glycosyltransferase involved in cell wall biosynthesis